ncbi:uncharacterized protein ACNS7B_022457 isoform 1-T1 [Menidia menidia]
MLLGPQTFPSFSRRTLSHSWRSRPPPDVSMCIFWRRIFWGGGGYSAAVSVSGRRCEPLPVTGFCSAHRKIHSSVPATQDGHIRPKERKTSKAAGARSTEEPPTQAELGPVRARDPERTRSPKPVSRGGTPFSREGPRTHQEPQTGGTPFSREGPRTHQEPQTGEQRRNAVLPGGTPNAPGAPNRRNGLCFCHLLRTA